MFSSRNSYIEALCEGRRQAYTNAPTPLCKLLLQSAIAHYEEIVAKAQLNFDVLIVAGNELDLEAEIKSQIENANQEDIAKLMNVFKSLGPQEVSNIRVGSLIVALKRDEVIDFDKI